MAHIWLLSMYHVQHLLGNNDLPDAHLAGEEQWLWEQ